MGLLVFQQSSGGTINVQGTNTASAYTWTIPASSDTFVGLAASQALTNKTIDSSAIGSTTPSTGAFTTVSASTSVTTPFVTSAASTNLLLKSAGTTAVTINTSQQIGIGTTSPSYLVDVSGAFSNDGVTPAMRLVNTSTNGYANLRLQGNSRGGSVDFYSGSTAQASLLVNSSMQFYIGGNGSTGTQAMTLDTSNRLLLNGTQTTGSSIYLQVNANGGNSATAGLGVFCNGSNLGNQAAYIYLANTNNYFYSNYDGNASARNQIGAVAGNSGGSTLSSGSTAWSTSSDSRLKNVTGTYTNALQDIAQIQPVKFTWKSDATNKSCVGVIAQSVQTVVPEAVEEFPFATGPDTTTEYLHVRYTELIPLMIASIQELSAQVTALSAKVTAFEAKVGA